MGERAKWSARDASVPWRRCRVTACDAPATATLRADPAAPCAWLVDLDFAGTGDDLCGRHADGLVPADGWTLHDERHRRGRADPSIEAARHSRPVAGPRNVIPDLDLRRRNEDHTVDDLLDAHSPLLSRAFAKSREAYR